MVSWKLARILAGALAGGVVGFALYRFVGCRTGACPPTANPYMAVAIWGAIGALLAAGR